MSSGEKFVVDVKIQPEEKFFCTQVEKKQNFGFEKNVEIKSFLGCLPPRAWTSFFTNQDKNLGDVRRKRAGERLKGQRVMLEATPGAGPLRQAWLRDGWDSKNFFQANLPAWPLFVFFCFCRLSLSLKQSF